MHLYIKLGTVCVKFDNANKIVSAAQSAVYLCTLLWHIHLCSLDYHIHLFTDLLCFLTHLS